MSCSHGRCPASTIVGGQEDGQLDLQRIGVLELVDQEVGESVVQRTANGGGVADEVAGGHEKVVEHEAPLSHALLGRSHREPPHGSEQMVEDLSTDRIEQGDADGFGVGRGGSDVLHRA